ncbi:MAG: macro domain-containing protein, partial [Clostridiales bacterium]|nr:macro domain-containing protein [Clostridiales bacterium]
MPFTIIRQDITKMKVDAIVNAANTKLLMGGGVCGAIFHAAGADELQAACDRLAPIRTGEAVLTPGFHLPAKYVIHAAGPVYDQKNVTESRRLLKSAYTESLVLARKNDCESIAFPLISSGIYGYPKKEALRVAVSAIREFLAENDMDIYLVVFDKDALSAGTELQESIKQYIDEYYVGLHSVQSRILLEPEERAIQAASPQICPDFLKAGKPSGRLDDLVDNLDEPISTTILRLIDAKGMTDTEVYKRANIDRRLFSKIRSGKGYLPGKRTILALAIAMELTLDETDDLLKRAGYALSHSQKFD